MLRVARWPRSRLAFTLLALLLVLAVGVLTLVNPASSNSEIDGSPGVSAQAETRVVVKDTFDREVENGWGSAPTGGAYELLAPEGFSVADDVARMDLARPGIERAATLTATRPLNASTSVRLRAPKTPSRGLGIFTAVYLRSDGLFSYRADLRFAPDQAVYLSISRFDGGPAKRVELAKSKMVATGVKTGDPLILSFRVVGTAPVQLAASLRQADAVETGWQQVVEDASASRLTGGGSIALWAYTAKSSDSKRSVLFDAFEVTELVGPVAARKVSSPARAAESASSDSLPPGFPTPDSVRKAEVSSDAGSIGVGEASYPVPPGAIIVSPLGTKTGRGSLRSPFSDVQQAVDGAPDGAVIVLRSGVYHQSAVLPADKTLTLQSYPGETVWFDGSSPVSDYERRGSTWVVPDWTDDYDHSPTYTKGAPDNARAGWAFVDPNHPFAAYPDQVWVDDVAQKQVGTREAVRDGSFFVDAERQELVLGTDPAGKDVRASTIQRALDVAGPSDQVRGIGIRRYATSVWQGGAVTVRGDRSRLDDVSVIENATTGISVTGTGVTLSRISALRNGMMGVHGHQADGLRVTKSLVAQNNLEEFNIAPSAGGMKITASREVRVDSSEFSANIGHGLWFDVSCFDVRVTKSVARQNVGSGIRTEISSRFLIAGNLVMGNRSDGLRVVNTDKVEIAANTLARNGGRNLALSTDSRRPAAGAPGHDPRHPTDKEMRWVSDDITVYNNVLSDGGGSCVVCILDSSKTYSQDDLNIDFDHNYYQRTSSVAPKYFSAWPSGRSEPVRFTSLDAHCAGTGQDRHSILSPSYRSLVSTTGAITPTVRSAASKVARRLSPAAVAALGATTGTRQLGAQGNR